MTTVGMGVGVVVGTVVTVGPGVSVGVTVGSEVGVGVGEGCQSQGRFTPISAPLSPVSPFSSVATTLIV